MSFVCSDGSVSNDLLYHGSSIASIEQLEAKELRFCQLLSFFECDRVPVELFRRACRPRLTWNSIGEQSTRLPGDNYVSSWLVLLLSRDTATHGIPHGLQRANDMGIIHIEGTQPFDILGFGPGWKIKVRNKIPSDQDLHYCIELLTVILHAYPEPYLELCWRELEIQLWEIIDSTCVPILAVLDKDSIIDGLRLLGWYDLSSKCDRPGAQD